MTAQKSISKPEIFKNPFIKARIKTNITINRKLATVICILHAIGFPLVMAMGVISEYYYEKNRNSDNYSYYPDVDIFIVAGVMAGVIALLAGFVVAMNIFKYQYKKSCVDMNLSLPLSSTQRFFTDYFSGLAIYLIPALCAWIIGDLIGLIGMGITDDMAEAMKIINYCGVCVVMAMILFYTLTVFCITCCGSIFEAISSSLIMNALIPLFLLVFGFCVCNSNPYGVVDDVIMIEQIYFTSPAGCIIFAGMTADKGISEIPYFWSWLISVIIYIALIVVLTYFLYKKRKAERVSKPYVYKTLYYVMTSVMLFIIIYAISKAADGYVGAIFVGAIVYFIFEVITKRGFKKFHHSVFRFIGTVASIFIIVAVSDVSNGFGVYKYVPNPAGVSKVSLTAWGTGDTSSIVFDDNENMYKDRSVIKAVTQVQKSYIDQYENPDKYDDYEIIDIGKGTPDDTALVGNSVDVEITYYMKNGNIVTRDYKILYEDYYKITSTAYTSDDFAEYAEDYILEGYENYRNDIIKQLTFNESKTNKSYDITANKNTVDELIKAYKSDLENMTVEDYYSQQIIGYIYYNLDIRENFTNTINFIKEYVPDFNTDGDNFKLSDFEGSQVSISKNIVMIDHIFIENSYEADTDYRRVSDKCVLISEDINGYYSDNVYAIGTNTVNADLEKLINVSKNVYDGTEIGGMITINYVNYYIPAEYKDLVNKVYKNLFGSGSNRNYDAYGDFYGYDYEHEYP